jgi:hypothetical protein
MEFTFLLDSGADDTVLSADLLDLVRHLKSPASGQIQLAGIGGEVGSITIDTSIGFKKETGELFEVQGRFSVFTEVESSDISLLGRDVTDRFSVIYDRPDEAVMLLSPLHRYEIKTA